MTKIYTFPRVKGTASFTDTLDPRDMLDYSEFVKRDAEDEAWAYASALSWLQDEDLQDK